MKNRVFVILTISILLLSGCDSTGTRTDEGATAVDRGSNMDRDSDTGSSATSFAVDDRSTSRMDALENPDHPLYNLLSERVIYFEYDKSVIQQQYRAVIEAHAQYLSQNPGVEVTLEGHADERGSREYNLALAERRAISVERQLTLLGASPQQIRTVSYGEERPVAQGHDESSWSLNRRVEILY